MHISIQWGREVWLLIKIFISYNLPGWLYIGVYHAFISTEVAHVHNYQRWTVQPFYHWHQQKDTSGCKRETVVFFREDWQAYMPACCIFLSSWLGMLNESSAELSPEVLPARWITLWNAGSVARHVPLADFPMSPILPHSLHACATYN